MSTISQFTKVPQVELVSGSNIRTVGGQSLLAGGNVPSVLSNTAGITGASQVTNIVSLSQADYDAIVTKDPSTLYIING